MRELMARSSSAVIANVDEGPLCHQIINDFSSVIKCLPMSRNTSRERIIFPSSINQNINGMQNISDLPRSYSYFSERPEDLIQ